MSGKKILLLDDSPTSLKALTSILETAGYEVIPYDNPVKALDDITALGVQLAIVDIVMPEMNGFTFIAKMREKVQIPTIVCSSLYTVEDKQKALRAYDVGALAILSKPQGFNKDKDPSIARLLTTVAQAFNATSAESPKKKIVTPSKEKKYRILGIGASLGGPASFCSLLPKLQHPFPIPIILVQHIEEGYDEALENWLRNHSSNRLVLIKDGMPLEPGTIYLAPYGHHVTVSPGEVCSLVEAKEGEVLVPSIDVLFQSLAKSFGEKGIGVIMTGMGKDGVKGLKHMYDAGAYTIAQHKDGCVMFGMPHEAIKADAVTSIVTLEEMPDIFDELLR